MSHFTEESDHELEQSTAPVDPSLTGQESEDVPAEGDFAVLQQELAEWKDLATRRSAELENMRRRTALEKEQLIHHASENVINKLLPVLDDLHHALEAATSSTDVEGIRQGLSMIYDKAMRILASVGMQVIDSASGDPFDVNMHEALMHVPSPLPEGHITQQVQRGYRLHDKVLRHAKVITSAGGVDPSNQATEPNV